MTAFDADILSDILRGVPPLVARCSQIDPAEQAVPIIVVEEVLRGRFAVIRQSQAGKGKVTLPEAYDLLDQSFCALASMKDLPYTDAAHKLLESLRNRGSASAPMT